MSQRQSDQPTGEQPGQQGQYQQSTAGGGQGAGAGGPAGGGSVQEGQQGTPGRPGGPTVGQESQAGLQGQQFPTRTHLGEEARTAMIETLNWVLADATILHTHAKFAHWNVKGLEFVGLHELFDEIAEAFEGHTDLIGERITALGGQAMGTAGMAVANCSLPSMPTDAVTGPEYVEILADRMAIHDANLYESIQAAQDYGDDDTADLLNEVSREVSQYLWFLEAHVQTQPIGTAQAGGASDQPGATGQPPQAQGSAEPTQQRPGGTQGSAAGTAGQSASGTAGQAGSGTAGQPAAGQSTPPGGASESIQSGGSAPGGGNRRQG